MTCYLELHQCNISRSMDQVILELEPFFDIMLIHFHQVTASQPQRLDRGLAIPNSSFRPESLCLWLISEGYIFNHFAKRLGKVWSSLTGDAIVHAKCSRVGE